jgi:hypothetical protein
MRCACACAYIAKIGIIKWELEQINSKVLPN